MASKRKWAKYLDYLVGKTDLSESDKEALRACTAIVSAAIDTLLIFGVFMLGAWFKAQLAAACGGTFIQDTEDTHGFYALYQTNETFKAMVDAGGAGVYEQGNLSNMINGGVVIGAESPKEGGG